MTSIHLAHSNGSTIEVSPHGAHLISWKTSDGLERLFLSDLAEFEGNAAIRGGVPVIFPQFSGPPPLRHGFARNLEWDLVEQATDHVAFELLDSSDTRMRWPHSFKLEQHFQLGESQLRMELHVTNRGVLPFEFTSALHSYFRVNDIRDAFVQGLQGRAYWDEAGKKNAVDGESAVIFQGMVDRVYHHAATLDIRLQTGSGYLSFMTEGFPDIVVWNPGAEAAAKLDDLDPTGFTKFVCLEAVAFTPISLEPGKTWVGSQIVRVQPNC